jgi:CheY-like chemotaxis protein
LANCDAGVRREVPILVVEDDAAIRQMIVETLRIDGYRAAGVADTTAAMSYVQQQRPDLVIADYHLPGTDGLELLRSLREGGFGDIPTLVISADVRPPDVPAASFIPKPFELDTILRGVRRALGRPKVNDQRTVATNQRRDRVSTLGTGLA